MTAAEEAHKNKTLHTIGFLFPLDCNELGHECRRDLGQTIQEYARDISAPPCASPMCHHKAKQNLDGVPG